MKRWMRSVLAFSLAMSLMIPGLAENASPAEAEPVEEAAETAEISEMGGASEPAETEAPEDGEAVPMEDPDEAGATPAVEDDDSLPDESDLEEEITEARELKYGDEGDDVKEIQIRLQELKYYTGNLSGRYREGTREAVKAFQEDYGLEKTGVADAATQSRLFTARYHTLRYGAKGDEVKELQTRLMELGYYKGKISGNFLGGTQKGLREFQERSGLPVTGAADPLTQEALFAAGAVGRNDTPDATSTPVPNLNGYLVDDADSAANSGLVMPDEAVPFTKELKSGSSGKLVKELQSRMTELGYYTGPVSGNYARQTVRAVKTIQVQNGLKDTGRVDEETWNVIFNDNRIVMPDQTPKPTPEPTPVPFAMTVDVTNQVTTVYGRDENGEYTIPVRRMICSTGTKANPSDVGDWVLNGRHAKWCVFPKWGNSYARYWTRINASIAFHSVIYTAVSYDAMKTSSYKALGSRASHGCIRLTVEDAKWVYDNIGEGTVVSIREDLPEDPELREAVKVPNLKKGTSIPVETPVPTPEPDYDASEPPDLAGRRLKIGSKGPEVFWVQTRLKELGYYQGYIGGLYLKGTSKAVRLFQQDQKIYANGEVTDKTLQALIPTPTPEPAPETPNPESTPTPETTPVSPEATTTPAPASNS